MVQLEASDTNKYNFRFIFRYYSHPRNLTHQGSRLSIVNPDSGLRLGSPRCPDWLRCSDDCRYSADRRYSISHCYSTIRRRHVPQSSWGAYPRMRSAFSRLY